MKEREMVRERVLKIFIIPIFMLCILALSSYNVFALAPVNLDKGGIAIKGYDPVAYFIEQRPVKGSQDLSYMWNGAEWWLSTQEHLELFKKEPEKYAPQYGGY
jgi:YHS domain-containing protein